MARTHARLLTSIWSNPDFVALDTHAQRLYILALSQPTVSFCGLVSYTARRWANFAADTTPADIDDAVKRLADARFVLLDEETEELMIRSFVKHDGVLKSPNITIAMSKDFDAIASKWLRGLFLAGLGEGFLEGLPDKTREGLAKPFVEAFHRAVENGFPEPPERVPVRALRPHGAEPLPLPQPYPSPPGGGESANGSARAAPTSVGEGKTQVRTRWEHFMDRIVAVLGERHRGEAAALINRWSNILDIRLIDQAIGMCEHADQRPRSIAYFETTLRQTAAQNGVDVPAMPAESESA